MATQALPYAFVNLGTARQELANRLYDPTQLFWSPAELNTIITEALRTWNALTGMWRGDFNFQSTPNTYWYDLTVQLNSLRPYTVTDAVLYQAILLHMLEPVTGPVSVQFSLDDMTNAVQRRRDEVLTSTSCTQTLRYVGAVNGRITLPDTVLDVRRMAYLPGYVPRGGYGSGFYGSGEYGTSPPNFYTGYVMWPEDSWAMASFDYNWTQNPPGNPSTYLMSTEPPLSFDTNCPPQSAGQYELLTIEAGGTLSFVAPSTLNVPDDWTWVIKFGALADLMGRQANAADPLRQVYAEQRYKMGLMLLEKAPALLAMRVGNVPLQVDAIRNGDYFNTNWEAQAPGPPREALYSGLNLVALAPPPDAGPSPGQPYMLTATVVENAPVPVADTDEIQMSRGDYDSVLDYCVHLAMFKAGGKEFSDTLPLFDRFLKQAALYGLKLAELAEFMKPIYDTANYEKNQNPVVSVAPAGGA
jgi:hypothetical protein